MVRTSEQMIWTTTGKSTEKISESRIYRFRLFLVRKCKTNFVICRKKSDIDSFSISWDIWARRSLRWHEIFFSPNDSKWSILRKKIFQKFEFFFRYDLTLARHLENFRPKKGFFKVSKRLNSQSYQVKINIRKHFSFSVHLKGLEIFSKNVDWLTWYIIGYS